jgi:hypothetical protein
VVLSKNLMDEIGEDRELLSNVIEELTNRGFRAVVESTFDLSPYQRQELEDTMTPELEAICRDACLMALKHDGKILYVEEGHSPSNLRVTAYCKGSRGGVECGVRFEC